MYFILAIMALSHVSQTEKAERSYWLIILDPWWPFHGKLFMESGKKVLLLGRILFPVVIVLYIAWGVQNYDLWK